MCCNPTVCFEIRVIKVKFCRHYMISQPLPNFKTQFSQKEDVGSYDKICTEPANVFLLFGALDLLRLFCSFKETFSHISLFIPYFPLSPSRFSCSLSLFASSFPLQLSSIYTSGKKSLYVSFLLLSAFILYRLSSFSFSISSFSLFLIEAHREAKSALCCPQLCL